MKKKCLGKIGMKLFCHFVEEDKITQNKYNRKKKSINKLYNNKIKYEKSTKPRPYNQKEKKKNND
jgi:hypothetical protein